MKKYILGFALLAGFVLTSCDTKNEGAIYNPPFQNVSFETATPAQVMVKSSSTDMFSFPSNSACGMVSTHM